MSGSCEGHGVVVEVPSRSGMRLVEGVDVSVQAGEMLGVVGETGAGKTVTMRALLGLLPAGLRASGELSLDSGSLSLADTERLRELLGSQTSVVLQNPLGMLDPVMRVGDQLIEGVVRKRLMDEHEAAERARTLLAEMGFEDVERVMDLYPFQLSGGMAQRVTTAMGMMPKPRLLVVDEPTSALDANVRVEVLTLLRRIAREEGIAVLLVSHDLGLVSHFCDAVVVMYAGRIVERGPIEEVTLAPAHPYTEALLDASATLTSRRREPLRVIPGAPPAPSEWPTGCVFAPRCPHATDRCRAERPGETRAGERSFACYHPRVVLA